MECSLAFSLNSSSQAKVFTCISQLSLAIDVFGSLLRFLVWISSSVNKWMSLSVLNICPLHLNIPNSFARLHPSEEQPLGTADSHELPRNVGQDTKSFSSILWPAITKRILTFVYFLTQVD